MRRQDRYILNGALIAGGTMILADIFMQWIEHKDKGVDFTWESYNGMRTLKRTLISAAVGGGLGYCYYFSKIREEAGFAFNSDEYLKKILTVEHLKANPAAYRSVIAYRAKIKQWMADIFGNRLVSLPEDTGSFIKRTAIGSNYDLDIILPFKRDSYKTLDVMYYDVYDIVKEAFSDVAEITKQTKAIGLTFENNGNPIHFDVVPGREINNYAKEKDLNLYVNPYWMWGKSSSFKTNVNIQKSMTLNNPRARATIKLLKVYKDRNRLPLPALIIEQCVVDALSEENFGAYTSQTANLLNCMEFISRKLEQRELKDIANSNNNLNAKITEIDRICVANQLRKDIRRINENPRYIKEIFEC